MAIRVTPLTPLIGTEIKTDIESLVSGRDAESLKELLKSRGVLVFRNLSITDEQQVAIAKTLGQVPANEGDNGIYKITFDPKLNDHANYIKGSMMWHSDGSLQPAPNFGALLRPMQLSSEGGDTEFCNTYAAFADLPTDEQAYYQTLQVVHSAERSQYYVNPEMSYEEVQMWQQYPSKTLPLVWQHASGLKSLLLGATADYVLGLSVEQSRALLAKLRDWATQKHYVYHHQWQLGDLLIWDNTGTMHRVLPYSADSGRLMHRTILAAEETIQ